jgi:hypothetical protein
MTGKYTARSTNVGSSSSAGVPASAQHSIEECITRGCDSTPRNPTASASPCGGPGANFRLIALRLSQRPHR